MFADVRYAGEGAPIHAITARISETRKTIWLDAFKVGMFPPLYKISLAAWSTPTRHRRSSLATGQHDRSASCGSSIVFSATGFVSRGCALIQTIASRSEVNLPKKCTAPLGHSICTRQISPSCTGNNRAAMTQVRSVRRKGSGALRLRLGCCLCAYSLRSQTMQHSVNPARHNLDFKIEPMCVRVPMRKLGID
jgi:hypothetical protein